LNHFWPKNITGGPHRAPENLKNRFFQVSKILEKWHILSSKPPKIINIDILNNFGCLETQTSPSGPPKNYFFENFHISAFFEVSQKSRFFGGPEGGVWVLNPP